MKKKGKFTIVFTVLALLLSGAAYSGSLDSTAAPGATSSYTLEDLYNRLNTGAAATQRTFTEPSAGPTAGTGHTIDDIYNLINKRAFVPKTGQTGCWDASGTPISCTGTGHDGEYQKGVTLPSPRFTDNSNGTVTDNLTGLIWLKNANCFEQKDWATALSCKSLASGLGCGLTDGSTAGQWRLPNRFELESLLDLSTFNPPLPTGHPFTGVNLNWYWTSTTVAFSTTYAWCVNLADSYVGSNSKTTTCYVWPVRDGK